VPTIVHQRPRQESFSSKPSKPRVSVTSAKQDDFRRFSSAEPASSVAEVRRSLVIEMTKPDHQPQQGEPVPSWVVRKTPLEAER